MVPDMVSKLRFGARSRVRVLPFAFVSPFVFGKKFACALGVPWFVSPRASKVAHEGECCRSWYTLLTHYLIAEAFGADGS